MLEIRNKHSNLEANDERNKTYVSSRYVNTRYLLDVKSALTRVANSRTVPPLCVISRLASTIYGRAACCSIGLADVHVFDVFADQRGVSFSACLLNNTILNAYRCQPVYQPAWRLLAPLMHDALQRVFANDYSAVSLLSVCLSVRPAVYLSLLLTAFVLLLLLLLLTQIEDATA